MDKTERLRIFTTLNSIAQLQIANYLLGWQFAGYSAAGLEAKLMILKQEDLKKPEELGHVQSGLQPL